ncbi:MAG: hypothetical protein QXJ06_04490 [Candidatus Aenigmatarchaeota archaeon]
MNIFLNKEEFLKLQKKTNLNFTEIANKIGISRSQLWRILNGHSNPGERFIAGFKMAFAEENFDKFFLIKPLRKSDTSNDKTKSNEQSA